MGLLDLPVEAMIPAWLGTGEPLRAQLLATTVGDTAVVFRLADEEPVLFPVSAASLSALVILVDRVSAGSVTIALSVTAGLGICMNETTPYSSSFWSRPRLWTLESSHWASCSTRLSILR